MVIEVGGDLNREQPARFNKATNDAAQAAKTAGTPAEIKTNKTEPKGAQSPDNR